MRILEVAACLVAVLLAVTECSPTKNQEVEEQTFGDPACSNPGVILDLPSGDLTRSGLGAPCPNNACQDGMVCCKNENQQSICDDIDECSAGTSDCTQICINNVGSFTCDCGPGYILAADGFMCIDIAECEASTCSGQGECIEVAGGGTQCVCDAGWTSGDCSGNIDDCSPNPCSNGGTCTDGVDSFSCQCASAWTRPTCDTDVVDCNSGSCSDNGVCNEEVGGGVICECSHGYTGDDCGTNIDDCSPNPCGNGGSCTDGVDSFSCHCTSAWTGDTCDTDVVDCTSNSCSGNGVCNEEVGGGIICECVAE